MVIPSPVFVVVDQAISATASLTAAMSSINIAFGRQATASVPRRRPGVSVEVGLVRPAGLRWVRQRRARARRRIGRTCR
jgi:hypothetical protein